jgi:hypothetical protein
MSRDHTPLSKPTAPSTTMRVLEHLRRPSTGFARSGRNQWRIRAARWQAAVAARALSANRCQLSPILRARSALAVAEVEAGAHARDLAQARRELDAVETTFAELCVLHAPRSR